MPTQGDKKRTVIIYNIPLLAVGHVEKYLSFLVSELYWAGMTSTLAESLNLKGKLFFFVIISDFKVRESAYSHRVTW